MHMLRNNLQGFGGIVLIPSALTSPNFDTLINIQRHEDTGREAIERCHTIGEILSRALL